MYFYCYVYVFLFLCIFCSVYSVFIVPGATFLVTLTEVFPCFFSVVRQMPRYNLQRRGTSQPLPELIVLFSELFVCNCVLHYCQWVSIQFQLTNISIYFFSDIGTKILSFFLSEKLMFSQPTSVLVHYCAIYLQRFSTPFLV